MYATRARDLRQMIEAAPKSLGWRARARVGETRRWYDLPEAPPKPAFNGGFLGRLDAEFAEMMGPLGPVIIDNEIASLGGSRESLPRVQLPELVERLSARIEDDDKRARFKEIMLDLLRGS